MKVNEGAWDRGIRIVVGIVLIVLGLSGGVAFPVAWDVVGAVLLLTGLSGFCLLYAIFHVSTVGIEKNQRPTPTRP